MLNQVITEVTQAEFLIIRADLNGSVREHSQGYDDGHRGRGINEAGEKVLELARAHGLTIANIYFAKREGHLIKYKSGVNRSQTDYFLIRRRDLKTLGDCKVIPGDQNAEQQIALTDFS